MSRSCYCDYGESPVSYHADRAQAKKHYSCFECNGHILPGDKYERVAALFEGRWNVARTCAACLDARDYITAHAPCFCWLHGSMLDDARDTLNEYGRESFGFFVGGMKRVLRAERHTKRTAQ